jgi:segregation and condensation protein B
MSTSLKSILESLIFVSLDPLTLEKIKSVLSEFSEEKIAAALKELAEDYSSQNRGIQITKSAGGYLFSTRPDLDEWITLLLRADRKNKLSPAALETLSTIAYHQPMTLAEISAMRGVDASYSLKTLLQKKLVKITGRKKGPGKPLIYRTSEKFLTYFGLDSLKDLPSKEEIEKILSEEKIPD